MRRIRRYRRTRRRNPVVKLILLFGLFVLLLVGFNSQVRPTLVSVTTNEATIKSVQTINDAVLQELQKDSVDYGDLVTVSRGSDGQVLSITTNVVAMNVLKGKLIDSIQNTLHDETNDTVYIPLGTLVGGDLFHGQGPNIPMKVTLAGNITADFNSSFESAGINQTKHIISLDIKASVYSFLPGCNTTTDVETNVLVAETIIVGEVPQLYAGIS